MHRPLLLALAGCSILTLPSHAAPAAFTEAQITRIVNDVRVIDPARGAKPAKLQQTVSGDLAVRTGAKSRAELLFSDQTLTRLGADTVFSFTSGTRDMSLDHGTMLLQAPKGHGGARIRTAAVTAAITGTTILLEHTAQRAVKVIVLEGSLRLSLNSGLGRARMLTAGKMIIMPPNARSIPEPVDVDLQKLVGSSALVKMAGKGSRDGEQEIALPSAPLVEKEIAKQAKLKQKGGLADTNLVIRGRGANVEVTSESLTAALDQIVQANRENPAAEARRGGPGGPGASDKDDSDEGKAPAKPGKPSKPEKPNPGRAVVINRTISAEPIEEGPGNNLRAGDLTVNSARKGGVAIQITSTGELLSLLQGANRGGTVRIESAGGAVLVDGGTIVAESGLVEMLNRGVSGAINLQNATISGDVVKIGALGRNGEVLIRGGTLSADTTLKLYAPGGNGSVRFMENTTLDGSGAKYIAGQRVTIDDAKTVHIGGSRAAQIFTDRPAYTGSGGNGTTTGHFSGAGATTSPRKDAPGF